MKYIVEVIGIPVNFIFNEMKLILVRADFTST